MINYLCAYSFSKPNISTCDDGYVWALNSAACFCRTLRIQLAHCFLLNTYLGSHFRLPRLTLKLTLSIYLSILHTFLRVIVRLPYDPHDASDKDHAIR
jgi:hypothetical protein